MDTSLETGQTHTTLGQQKIAVPYVSPPPPDGSSRKKFKSPIINGVIIAFVILLGGFMTYNFVGHQLTQTASISDVRVSPTPIATPTAAPTPTPYKFIIRGD